MHAPALRRPAWIFDRAERLSALAARARELGHALYRERCDVPGDDAEARAALAARIAANEARFRRLSATAAKIRRDRRFAPTR